MGTRLYVGNLPFSADEQQIRTLFEQGGRQVREVKPIVDRETGRPLTVNEAREREGGAGGGMRRGPGGGHNRDRY